MWPYYLVCAGIFCTASLTFTLDRHIRAALDKIFLPALLIALALFAGLRAPGVDLDYMNHLEWFNRIASERVTIADFVKDPGYVLICSLISWIGLHFTSALLVIEGMTLFAIWCVGRVAVETRWLAVFVYLFICRFFLPQEMTEIRAAIAIPLMTLAVFAGLREKRWLAAGLYLCAVGFHLSVLIALPVVTLAIIGIEIKSRKWIMAIIAGVGIAHIILHNILQMLAEFARTADYLNGADNTMSIRLLSVYFLIRVFAVAFAGLLLWKRLSAEGHLIVFGSALGLALQAVLSFNDTLALRGSEVFGFFDILLIMIPFRFVRGLGAVCYLIIVLLLGLVFFHSGLKMVEPYHIAGI
jgi:uncharacterized membrane protein